MAVRQRRGSNRWPEKQYFVGDIQVGRYLVKDDTSNNAVRIRDSGDSNDEKLIADTIQLSGGLKGHSGDLLLKPGSGYITQIGDAGSTSHSLNTNDDLFVTGQLEVDGDTWFDDTVFVGNTLSILSSLLVADDYPIRFGDDGDCKFKWDSTNSLVDCTTGGGGPLALPCPQVGSLPTLQTNNTVTFGVDETNDELEIRVKDSGGTIRSATVTGLT